VDYGERLFQERDRVDPTFRAVKGRRVILLLGDQLDRALVLDWCERVRARVLPWVGAIARGKGIKRGAPVYCTSGLVTLAHMWIFGAHPVGPYKAGPSGERGCHYPPLPTDTSKRLLYVTNLQRKLRRAPDLVVVGTMHWEVARWNEVPIKTFGPLMKNPDITHYVQTRVQREFLVDVNWLLHQLRSHLPNVPIAWRTTPPPPTALYVKQWLKSERSDPAALRAVALAAPLLNRAGREAVANNQGMFTIEVAKILNEGQDARQYLRARHEGGRKVLDTVTLTPAANWELANLLLNIVEQRGAHKRPAGGGKKGGR